MTITYSLDVANTRFFGFTKLLCCWKGSIYKILWKEFVVFILGYTMISLTYRYFLGEEKRRMFESVVMYFEAFLDFIPLSFVLGFYVSLVIGRWWKQYDAIPWPDRMCYLITTYVHGSDERSRIIRRTMGRYLILMQAFTFQSVSTAVKKRFPTNQHFVLAGIMTKEECRVFENVKAPFGKWWLPAQWFCALAMRARKEDRIKDSRLFDGLLKEFLSYRTSCATMFDYDWITVPLVYTQVVTLATYSYGLALMVGRQYLDPEKKYRNNEVDLYIPVFTLLQFFFYLGWLKVAEQIVNPYGEDDDDFELNWCLDRSCQVVHLLVDHFHAKHPKLIKDPFWDEQNPELPQTKITANNAINPQLGSAFNLEVNPADAEFIPLETLLEEDNDANIYDSEKQSPRFRNRPSFLMSILNSHFGQQNIRKTSLHKAESFKEVQGRTNPVFTRSVSCKNSSPTNSRTSSLAAKTMSSPTGSRTSSLNSFQHSCISRQRLVPFEVSQLTENNIFSNGVKGCEECEGTGIMSALNADVSGVKSSYEVCDDESNSDLEIDVVPKMDSYMPSIPEERSRIMSAASLVSNAADCSSKQLDSVQTLVAEASKVLEELNKAVKAGKHKKDCESKGYESCCSLSSDGSCEDEVEERETLEVLPRRSMPMLNDHQNDVERTLNL